MDDHCRCCRSLLPPLALALAALAALTIDLPVARVIQQWNRISTVHAYLGYFDMFEPFGHGLGVALVLVILHQLDPSRRWALARVLVCGMAAGGAANLLKMSLMRIRPNDFGFDGSVWTTFGQFLPALSAGSVGQSFPSAHTATAAGMASALIWLYPQGKLLFIALATLVGCQRIVSGAHYPSDVLTGAALGCLVAQLFLHVGKLPALFDRLEQRWRRQPSSVY